MATGSDKATAATDSQTAAASAAATDSQTAPAAPGTPAAEADMSSESGAASSYVYVDHDPACSLCTAWTYGRPPAAAAETISSPRSPTVAWTPWDAEIGQTAQHSAHGNSRTFERIQRLHAAGFNDLEDPWLIIDHLLNTDGIGPQHAAAESHPGATSTGLPQHVACAAEHPAVEFALPPNAACAAETPSLAASPVACPAAHPAVDIAWPPSAACAAEPPAAQHAACAAEPSRSYPPLNVARAREQPKPRATEQNSDASDRQIAIARPPPTPPPACQVARQIAIARPPPPPPPPSQVAQPQPPPQIGFIMPASALAVSEMEEQLPPPVLVELTRNSLSNLRGVLHEANMWLPADEEIMEFAAWFGVPNSQQRFGSTIEMGMVRLAARYLRQSRHAWYMRQCEGSLKWGWWLSPYVLSKRGSLAPPASEDCARWPCVYFCSDGRWWMICLHLLWYDNKGWETHILRITPW